jgi:hypothetical protein
MTARTFVRTASAALLLLAGTVASVTPTFASNPNGAFQNGTKQNGVNQNGNPQNANTVTLPPS